VKIGGRFYAREELRPEPVPVTIAFRLSSAIRSPTGSGKPRMTRMVVDANYLQKDELRDYLSGSAENKVVVTPYVELEMHKGISPGERSQVDRGPRTPFQASRVDEGSAQHQPPQRPKKGDEETAHGRLKDIHLPENGAVIPGNKRDAATCGRSDASYREPSRLEPSSSICATMR
jgi:hypothetical protein